MVRDLGFRVYLGFRALPLMENQSVKQKYHEMSGGVPGDI